MAIELERLIVALGVDSSELTRGLNEAARETRSILGGIGDFANRGFSGLQNVVRTGLIGGLAGVTAGVGALGAGMVGAVKGGVELNSTLENVEAQLLAFTKDGDQARAILEDIRTEAARTPFAFQDMAKATAGLLPAAKQSGLALMDLVKQAEILAASNPEQGLEGAAFALREAVSGDFTSVIERFNLPRQRLNELKEQGVPAIEAIQTAMAEMGLDASLVSNMAETMTGRWSTFLDTLDTLKASLAAPLFDLMKDGLTGVQGLLDENMPRLQEFAVVIGERLAGAVQWAIEKVTEFGPVVIEAFVSAGAVINGFIETARAILAPIVEAISKFVSWKDVLIALGAVAASIVIPALASIVAAAAPVIAVFAALVGAIALLRKAWESDFLEMRTSLTAFWENNVKPAFEEVRRWAADNLPRALERLSDFWERTLLPALRTVWSFIDANIIPLLGALVNVWFAALRVEIALVKAAWETALLPALRAVWSFASQYIVPIFGGMASSIGSVSGVVQNLIGWLDGLASKFTTLADKIPDWLIPGSPTPFERGLRGIGAAVDELARKSIEIPIDASTNAAQAFASAPAGMQSFAALAGNTTNSTSVVFNQTINVPPGMDAAAVGRETRAAGDEFMRQWNARGNN